MAHSQIVQSVQYYPLPSGAAYRRTRASHTQQPQKKARTGPTEKSGLSQKMLWRGKQYSTRSGDAVVLNTGGAQMDTSKNVKNRPREHQKWIRIVRFTTEGLEEKTLDYFMSIRAPRLVDLTRISLFNRYAHSPGPKCQN